ncbi:hypothetical protein NQZ68_006113 [Dissostichus eleginoides]|nr:hypothetical protein NQZ68_006113 [Dissostichus eleginoides]
MKQCQLVTASNVLDNLEATAHLSDFYQSAEEKSSGVKECIESDGLNQEGESQRHPEEECSWAAWRSWSAKMLMSGWRRLTVLRTS